LAETALVTGASVGIGLELAKLLAADGHNLVLVSRDLQKLNSVACELRKGGAGEVRVIARDLAEPESCGQIADELAAQNVAVDILINNAGFGVHGLFWEADLKRQLDMVQVNVTALTHLTRLFLPGMIQRRRGKVMNVSSMAAFVPGPFMAGYYASKAYVMSLSVALSDECRGRGVSVTAVCPGPTRTEFHTRAQITDTKLFRGQLMSAQRVAEIGYRGMLRGKPLVITGRMNSFLAQMTRLIPRSFAANMTSRHNRLRVSDR
jgi:uncharacterized protein